jgi:glycosyltransferase involved in cell wall biosynthesis
LAQGPLVSIIMIFKDASAFLAEAVESVTAQSWPEWELLLVDDGSIDASTRIAQAYASNNPDRIRYIEHPGHENRGMSASRNLGLKGTRGEYIAFLDADDVWLPCKLAQQVDILVRHTDAGMVYGQALIWHSWSGSQEHRDYKIPLGAPTNRVVPSPQLLPVLLRNKCQTPIPSNVLLRRSVVDRVGGFEERFRGMYEDQVFFSKVELEFSVYVSTSCWLKYRQHGESCTAEADARRAYLEQRRPFLFWLEEYMYKRGVPPESAAWVALRRETWPYRHPKLHRIAEPLLHVRDRCELFLQGLGVS